MHSLPAISPLQTDRLILRKLTEADAEGLFTIRGDARLYTYLPAQPDLNPEASLAFIQKIERGLAERKWYYWGVFDRLNGKLLGTACLWSFSQNGTWAEIGYGLSMEAMGKGFMSEACDRVLEYAHKTLQLKGIEAVCHAENQASVKLLRKKGFTFVRAMRDDEKTGEELQQEIHLFSLTFA